MVGRCCGGYRSRSHVGTGRDELKCVETTTCTKRRPPDGIARQSEVKDKNQPRVEPLRLFVGQDLPQRYGEADSHRSVRTCRDCGAWSCLTVNGADVCLSCAYRARRLQDGQHPDPMSALSEAYYHGPQAPIRCTVTPPPVRDVRPAEPDIPHVSLVPPEGQRDAPTALRTHEATWPELVAAELQRQEDAERQRAHA